jgi:outer membrane protein assembly factor BamB
MWSFRTLGAVISSPAVANGVVYAGSYDDSVFALNASTGALLWSFATGGYVGSSVAVANGVVYVSSQDNNVYALNASTGALLWSFTIMHGISSPTVANGMVYVGSGAKLYAFGLPPAALVPDDGVTEEH